MDNLLYVRTTLTVPGAGTAVHVAELAELDTHTCEMRRIVALAPNEAVIGAATTSRAVGNIDIPRERVPHPATYAAFPDISSEAIEATTFNALWSEAAALYGDL